MNEPVGMPRQNLGSWIVDCRGTILGFDDAMEALTGWPSVEVVGRNKNLGRQASFAESGGSLKTLPLYDGDIRGDGGTRPLELTLHCRDGRLLDVETSTKRLSGPGERILIRVLRILPRAAAAAGQAPRQRRDALTGLADREAFASQLKRDFAAAVASARPLALVLVDVDHLREINDREGHDAGDDTLRKLAAILRVSVEDERRIARLGDDDFAILLPDAGRADARQVAAGVRSTVERSRFLAEVPRNGQAQVTVSLGAASFPADAECETELLERAREALEEARSMGRNRVWCYLRRPRVPLQVPVYFDGADPLLVGYSRDLSPSGIFVQTGATLDVGMRCALVFPLPGQEARVHVVGRVVRAVPPDVEASQARIPGIGIEFERFCGTTDRRAIESFLHRNESTSMRPETGLLSI